MSNEKFWKRMRQLLNQLEHKIEKENEDIRSAVSDYGDRIHTEQGYQAEMLRDITDKVERKSVWNHLIENEDFQELSEKSQKVIWELAKIEEDDSPKTQSEIADQYEIDRSRVSQLKQKMGELDVL